MSNILIAGTNSGCGKTTTTISILSALKARGLDVASFKCGPDYIDPMFHREVIGISTHNLDPFFCDASQLKSQYDLHKGKDFTVIEGVMGFYDGIGTTGEASTYTVAQAIDANVILVINAAAMSTSAGAIIKGFKDFKPNSHVKGVIFNRISEKMYPMMAKIAEEAGVKAYGFLPKNENISVESRHLGLVTAGEIEDIKERVISLGQMAEKYIDLDGLIALSEEETKTEVEETEPEKVCTLAVARDNAFCFIYQENLEMLESFGIKLKFFSPLTDEHLPEDSDGLYLCGGYPELYKEELSKNVSIMKDIKDKIASGLPTLAECGGFMYLNNEIEGVSLVGAIDGKCHNTGHLSRFGYVTITAKEDNLLCKAGGAIRAHEFHYYDSSMCGEGFEAKKASNGSTYDCINTTENLYDGYPHIYFPANPDFAKSFMEHMVRYQKTVKE